MIITIIEELKKGNNNIAESFAKLDDEWGRILKGMDDLSEDDIADRLSQSQYQIERICGGRNIGKAIMPWSAFSHLYSQQDGFGDNLPEAVKLAKAFEKSTCSIEVKFGAKQAAKAYRIAD